MEPEEPPQFYLAECMACGARLLVPADRCAEAQEAGTAVLTVKQGPHAGEVARCPFHGAKRHPLRHVTRDTMGPWPSGLPQA